MKISIFFFWEFIHILENYEYQKNDIEILKNFFRNLKISKENWNIIEEPGNTGVDPE